MSNASKANVNTPGSHWVEMEYNWRLIRNLLGGTRAMRIAGDEYLPKMEKEDRKAYENRKNRSVLFNFFKRTVKAIVGKPFSKPMNKEELSPAMEEHSMDIDLEGNDITIFCRNWFEDAVEMGISYVLVDYPKTEGEQTRFSERANNIRPYWVLIKAEQVIDFKSVNINGKHMLQQVRVRDEQHEEDGEWGKKLVRRVRVYDLMFSEDLETMQVQFRVYREPEKEGGADSSDWILEEDGIIDGVQEIPIVPLYTEQTGFMTAEPPLLDLAYLNVAHWQSSSDHRNIIHVASVPIMFGSGFNKDAALNATQVGPNRAIWSTKEGATLQFVEHSGRAIESGRTHLEDLKQEMTVIGMELLARQKPGGVTATEVAIDSAAADSCLKAMVTSLNDAVERAKLIHAQWMDEEDQGQISANEDFYFSIFDMATPEWWLKASTMGIITKKTVLTEAKKAGLISDDIDIELELEMAEEEGGSLLGLFDQGDDDETEDSGSSGPTNRGTGPNNPSTENSGSSG